MGSQASQFSLSQGVRPSSNAVLASVMEKHARLALTSGLHIPEQASGTGESGGEPSRLMQYWQIADNRETCRAHLLGDLARHQEAGWPSEV